MLSINFFLRIKQDILVNIHTNFTSIRMRITIKIKSEMKPNKMLSYSYIRKILMVGHLMSKFREIES